MQVQQIMQRKTADTASYKPLTLEEIELSPAETEKVILQARLNKLGETNQAAYAAHVKAEPSYVIPTADMLERALIADLKNNYGWQIDEFNVDAIRALALYFSQDNGFEKLAEGYSLKKGLMLFGPVGCGKTTLLRHLQKNSANPYLMVSCRDVAASYAEHGPKSIQHFSAVRSVTRREWMGHETVGYCFDDLGTEDMKKNFGNASNVMEEILLNRYDGQRGIGTTHLTTNLSTEEIKTYYGKRLGSRMREMFNIVWFDQNAPDRRK